MHAQTLMAIFIMVEVLIFLNISSICIRTKKAVPSVHIHIYVNKIYTHMNIHLNRCINKLFINILQK